jgi:Holliday junction resolvase
MVGFKGRKQKGSKAERELISKFWANHWAAFRAAGSGSQQFPAPDVMAAIRQLAIEVKVTKDKSKYFTKEEIDALIFFAKKFGAQAWTCVKFGAEDYVFIHVEDLDETEKSYKITQEKARLKGLSFEEIING